MEIEQTENTITVRGIEGDMGETVYLTLMQQEDGDVIVELSCGVSMAVKFCTLAGGGRHPIIAKKLRELIADLVAAEK